MRDIVVPDIDEAIEDEPEALQAGDGNGAAAVTALIATLRLRDPALRGSGAMIVRWCDHGEQIELEIEAWPSEIASNAAWVGAAMLDSLFAERCRGDPSDEATSFDETEADERPPRRDCTSLTVASGRLHRRIRRR